MSGFIEVNRWAAIDKPLPCCGMREPIYHGIPFLVANIGTNSDRIYCANCDAPVGHEELWCGGIGGDPTHGFPLALCRRLDDPPTEPETLSRELEKQ